MLFDGFLRLKRFSIAMPRRRRDAALPRLISLADIARTHLNSTNISPTFHDVSLKPPCVN